MAASSSIAAHYSYDVFINHRGPDVKKTFASHLYHGLSKHGLRVFLDEPELQPGDSLTSQIKGAVGTASVHVAVFSPSYAESRWCLDELLLMLESGKTIIPVFYHVTPGELRWTRGKAGKYAEALQKLTRGWTPGKTGKYAKALRKLAKTKTYDPQSRKWRSRYDFATIEKWRNALSRVAEISGFELKKCNGDEGELVENVVRCVLKKVEKTQFHVAKYPTGLDEKVEEFEKVLLKQQQSETPPILGIVGLGGLGKTTLAKELYNRKRSDYSSCCFLSDVRDNARKDNLISLQKKILKELTGSDLQKDSIDENKTLLNKHLSSSQIFVVLDDVDDVDQVDALLPDQTAIRSDSLILITSRYKNILKSSGIKNSSIYNLTGLNEQHSRELFCSHAFMQPYPFSRFEFFVNKFLDACQGLPLSLKVFGALLCGQNDLSYWEGQLDKLRRILPTDIKQRLQISIDALDEEEREIFLDLACFFIGENRDMAIKIWDGSPWNGFQKLEDRCLVEVDSENVIHMHDHLRDLGRDISKAPGLVCETENIDDLFQPSDDLLQPSHVITEVQKRLSKREWHHRISQITEVRGIRMLRRTNRLSKVAWHRGILQITGSGDGLLESILRRAHSSNLLWLRWDNCSYSSLPSWIPMRNLRVLELDGEISTSLWEGECQPPSQLRDLQIGCVLLKIPDSIGKLKYLERISLSPRLIHEISRLPEEFCDLESLKTLVLQRCEKMKSLPDSFGNLRNLQRIDLSQCHSLERLPETFRNLVKLKYLKLSDCSKLTMSSETLGNISTLEHIYLDRCAEIKELPNAVVKLSDLEVLVVGSPLLDTLPPSLGELRNLKTLRLMFCKKLKCLPDSVRLLTQLTELKVWGCPISELPSLHDLRNLKTLYLYDCKELKCLPDSVELLTQLTELTVDGCEKLKCLPDSVGLLTQLTELRVWRCPISELPSLRDLRNLKTLLLVACKELKCLPSLCDLRNLKTLWLVGCKELKCLPDSVGLLTQLTELRVTECPIREVSFLRDLRNLKTLELCHCKELKCLPASVGLLTELTELTVSGCPISELPSLRDGDLRNLRSLFLSDGCELEEIRGVEHLRSLEGLRLDRCVKLKKVRGLAQCTKLWWLSVEGCSELEDLEGVEHCTSLWELRAKGCPKLQLHQRLEGRLELD